MQFGVRSSGISGKVSTVTGGRAKNGMCAGRGRLMVEEGRIGAGVYEASWLLISCAVGGDGEGGGGWESSFASLLFCWW